MFSYTNKTNVSLPLAVFLTYDSYDYDDRPNVISATTLLKPVKQIILARQNRDLLKEVDVLDLVASRMGTAIHDACEAAWTDPQHILEACKALGINPDNLEISAEQRHEKEINGFIISGKYDLVLNGHLHDYKSTSVWSYIFDSNATKYSQQGSIYRWLAPDIITDDVMDIQFIFTDWSATKARQDKNYPQQKVMTRSYPLMSPEETQNWIMEKTNTIAALADTPQQGLPVCSEEDLWASEPKWKYYKKPGAARATKVFDNEAAALNRLTAEGCGEVLHFPGQVKACTYCSVINICEQKNQLVNEGRLLL